MKKFLTFLLIAIIACKTVKEMEDEELIKGKFDEAIKRLKKIRLDILIEYKKFGDKAAEQFCCSMLPDICPLCGLYVKYLERFIN